jgi:hypothetical protein
LVNNHHIPNKVIKHIISFIQKNDINPDSNFSIEIFVLLKKKIGASKFLNQRPSIEK